MNRIFCLAVCLALLLVGSLRAEGEKPIKVLFLGDNGPHRPAERFRQLEPVLARRGIVLTYTDQVATLNPQTLAGYDGLLIYANTTTLTPEQEKALLDFVEGGKGFIPVHCASYCFLNSAKYVDLVGARFLKHGSGTFRTILAEPGHPVMQGFAGFESWDETYVHTKHNERDRTVLEYRIEGNQREPWTWVRTQGQGRVFYTAWGHDHRTWGHPGFHNLLERGIRWATGYDPAAVPAYRDDAPFPVPPLTPRRTDVKPFEYVDVGKKIPNYVPGAQWGKQGEPHSRMQKPLPAAESLKHFVTPAGFRVELFAAEPDLGGKPLCMAWDERGRLWVAETYDYPNELQPPGQGRDRIRICEDTDGDGKADKFTVFADRLSIPTSLTFHKGGVIVFDGTQTIYLKDSDGDDRADVRQVLFGTWAQSDTHGGPSNMQYGLDNWIWAMQGYNNSRLTVGGETHQFRQGFFRFKPSLAPAAGKEAAGEEVAIEKLEFLRSTDNNTWGLGISEEGIVFGSTANRNPSVYLPIPNRYYEAVRGWAPSLVLRTIADTHLFRAVTDKVRQVDHHGGYTAGAGHALYTARTYPQEYWNRTAFVCEPTGHLVGTFVLRPQGSDFRSQNLFNLLASYDEWSAPIMAEVGPDGHVWVIDWYNYIVQHNPTPQGFKTGKGNAYETDLRDKKHGRIYRVVYEAATPPAALSLKDASPQKLVETLRNDNLLWRRHAQRLLVERGQRDVVPALCQLVRDRSVDALGLNVGAIHALWTLHGLGVLDGSNAEATAVAFAALTHPSAGVRRNAVQVLPRNAEAVTALLDAGLTRDPHPQVRLLALLALADQPPTPRAGEAVAAALENPDNAADRWIPDAAICAAARNSEHFLKALTGQRRLTPALLTATAVVAEHYARGGPGEAVGPVLAALATADPQVADAAVRGLARGWPAGKPPRLDEQAERDLERLVNRLSAQQRGQLIKLVQTWGSQRFEKYAQQASQALLARLQDDQATIEERLEAARDCIAFRPTAGEAVQAVLDQVTPRTPPELAAGLLRALLTSEAPDAGRLLLERLVGLAPSAREAGLGVLLGRPAWTRLLLEAIDQGTVRLAELSLDQKQALAVHPDHTIRRRAQELLQRGGALPNADRQKVVEELLPVVNLKGDADAGKVVFKNQCAKCHVHGGEGTRIGPDLTGMAVHPKEELLVNILDPSRSVEGNFRVYTLTTRKGLVLTGLLASESRTAVELFDAEGKKLTILREDIDEMLASTKSLMPDGFEKQLSRKDLADLLEFLTRRGKYLPLPLDKVATAVSTRGMFYSEAARAERLVFDDWKPKTVEGVPFHLVDPQGDRVPNVVLLYGPQGTFPPKMPRSVSLPCQAPVRAVHLLSGVSGWGYPYGELKSVTLIVRFHYADGQTEDHPLRNGEHFADYIRRVDVPGSKFAFDLHGRQIRYLVVQPRRTVPLKQIDFVKGSDDTAPVVMAVTVEAPE